MRAWWVDEVGSVTDGHPLVLGERPDPEPGPGQVRVRVSVCGVCRTDLHVVEGDLAVHRPHVVPGHEIVGRVDRRGPGAERFSVGERVGIAWLRGTDGSCRFCARGDENLCLAPAVHRLGPRRRVRRVGRGRRGLRLPACPTSSTTRRPRRCCAPASSATGPCAGPSCRPGGRLGIYGFGGSAHLAAQVALFEGATVHVMTRSAAAQALALDLGAASAGDAYDEPPEPLDAAILFAPVGELVPVALRALDRGGTLAIAGIHLSDIPPLHYATDLFEERQVRSVTANTRADGEEFLALAARIPLRPTVSALSVRPGRPGPGRPGRRPGGRGRRAPHVRPGGLSRRGRLSRRGSRRGDDGLVGAGADQHGAGRVVDDVHGHAAQQACGPCPGARSSTS